MSSAVGTSPKTEFFGEILSKTFRASRRTLFTTDVNRRGQSIFQFSKFWLLGERTSDPTLILTVNCCDLALQTDKFWGSMREIPVLSLLNKWAKSLQASRSPISNVEQIELSFAHVNNEIETSKNIDDLFGLLTNKHLFPASRISSIFYLSVSWVLFEMLKKVIEPTNLFLRRTSIQASSTRFHTTIWRGFEN